jgi:ubiquinone biosynthesis protein UbiJ
MPGTPAWLASVEALLNRNIGASAQATALTRRLRGTSLQVDVEGLSRVRASVFEERLALVAGDDSATDALISGSALALLQLLSGSTRRAGERRTAQIRGDAEIANLYRELFLLARPDLEEELSRFVGDMPARRAVRFAQHGLAWMQRTASTARENLAEYLQEESRDLVNQPEFEEFLRGVDEVREAAARVEARLAGLEQRLKGRA